VQGIRIEADAYRKSLDTEQATQVVTRILAPRSGVE